MSLKCSLFGHLYGETQVEHDREQDGNEVITTVREVRTCSRCAKRLVVSENKEVTTVEATNGGETSTAKQSPSDGQPETTESPPVHSGRGFDSSSHADSDGSPGFIDDDDLPPAHEEDATFINDDGEEVDPEEWIGEDDEERSDELDNWEPDIEPETTDESESSSESTARSKPEPTRSITVPKGEFRCPECGFTTPVEESSYRAGDFCPECHIGVLEQHNT